MQSTSRRKVLSVQFFYYLLSVILVSFQMFAYIFLSGQTYYMDFLGWCYYAASCFSHAAQVLLIPFLLTLPFVFLRKQNMARWVQIVISSLISVFMLVDTQVFSLYRFHINGFILSMVFGQNAGDIFEFSPMLYVKQILLILIIIFLFYGISRVASRLEVSNKNFHRPKIVVLLVVLTLFAQLTHAYAAFNRYSSVIKCTEVLPFYFPIRANGLMIKLGFKPKNTDIGGSMDDMKNASMNYPLKPLEIERPDTLPNVVMIFIDSWNVRTMNEECMPNISKFASRSHQYMNHRSSSNGTTNSMFGVFFGLPGKYWDAAEADRVSPLLVEESMKAGYDFRVYASASLQNPPFDQVLFRTVPNLRLNTPGETSYLRDSTITADFIADLDELNNGKKPFFSFVFYDLPHSISVPADKNKHFTPAWEYADYMSLSNDIDPTPFYNLYRNCCYETDRFVGQVLTEMEKRGLMENTVIIISGDHSQEFNENKKNYWGHNGNYSGWQIHIPLIWYAPGIEHKVFEHSTSHYDISPTLMHDCLGVKNPPSDYSMGCYLSDSASRGWHFVGNSMSYAFILEDGKILENKVGGVMEVTDSNLNIIQDYVINPQRFRKEIDRLNKFFK